MRPRRNSSTPQSALHRPDLLARRGLGDVQPLGGAALDELVAAHPDQTEALRLDVTGILAVDTAVRDVVARHGRIDVLVNNAGRTHVGAFEETADDELRALFDLHVLGPAALVARRAAAHARAGSGAKVSRTRAYVSGGDGTQAGDPAKAAALTRDTAFVE
ncbi:SDR family oxidoreductase [Streptomyces sp. TRM70350]|nr:SDR family NAD(P)-dependent oxidoreductase [Streptomyces sp. TRM70350]MBV7700759.1 SDR family oxidoreductase [Streptomyces sp. TRM70350]